MECFIDYGEHCLCGYRRTHIPIDEKKVVASMILKISDVVLLPSSE